MESLLYSEQDKSQVLIDIHDHASESSASIALKFLKAGSHVQPIVPLVEMSDSSLPTGTLTATQFCAMIFRQPDFMSAPITRIDWFEKDSWPLYHQYLMFETVYKGQVYDLRVETLGSVDRRNRTALETLALSTLGLGFLGNSKLQVQVSKRDNSIHGPNLLDQVPRANLLLSMSKVDDPLFSQLLCRNEWHFTSVNPGSRLTDRWCGPTLDALCRTLWTILQKAPNYDVENLNCYFVSRTIVITLFGLCPPLPRVTWTLHTQYLYSYTIAEVPWYRLHWRPESQFFATKPSTLNIEGSFMDHVRQIILYEIRGDRYFYLKDWNPIHRLDLRYTRVVRYLRYTLVIIIILGAPFVFRPISWFELVIIDAVVFGWMRRSCLSRNSTLHRARSDVMEDMGLPPEFNWPVPKHALLLTLFNFPRPGCPLTSWVWWTLGAIIFAPFHLPQIFAIILVVMLRVLLMILRCRAKRSTPIALPGDTL